MVLACAEAGVKGISTDKPLAAVLANADEMVEICRKRGVVYSGGTMQRATHEVQEAARRIHAGEFGPASNVREAIERLKVRRIQHGVRAFEDESVLALIKEVDATLDLCPISNLKLQVVQSMGNHPIRRFFDQGIRCTLSTDDTFSFGNRLTDEYEVLAEHLAFTPAELAQLAKNGFEVADLDDDKRSESVTAIEQLLADG